MVLHSRELVVCRKGGGKKAADNWSAVELDDLELVRARKQNETIMRIKSVETFGFWFSPTGGKLWMRRPKTALEPLRL